MRLTASTDSRGYGVRRGGPRVSRRQGGHVVGAARRGTRLRPGGAAGGRVEGDEGQDGSGVSRRQS